MHCMYWCVLPYSAVQCKMLNEFLFACMLGAACQSDIIAVCLPGDISLHLNILYSPRLSRCWSAKYRFSRNENKWSATKPHDPPYWLRSLSLRLWQALHLSFILHTTCIRCDILYSAVSVQEAFIKSKLHQFLIRGHILKACSKYISLYTICVSIYCMLANDCD